MISNCRKIKLKSNHDKNKMVSADYSGDIVFWDISHIVEPFQKSNILYSNLFFCTFFSSWWKYWDVEANMILCPRNPSVVLSSLQKVNSRSVNSSRLSQRRFPTFGRLEINIKERLLFIDHQIYWFITKFLINLSPTKSIFPSPDLMKNHQTY